MCLFLSQARPPSTTANTSLPFSVSLAHSHDTMSGLPIRSLRQLAIGSSQALRPLASTTKSTTTTTTAPMVVTRAASSGSPFKIQDPVEAAAWAAKVARLRAKRRALAKTPSTAAVQAQRLPKPKRPTTIPPKPTTPPVVPYRRYKEPKPDLTKFPEGHGEQIWIYNHIVTNQVVYSHSPVLRVCTQNLQYS